MPEPLLHRRQAIWQHHPFGTGRGLEIGPLHRTIVRRDEADVRYVDVLDRAGLVEHYADDAGVDTDLIPEIDFALVQSDGRTSSLADAVARDAPYDWVVASHVAEHVPDLIGWLADLAEVVVDDGALVLAVPDRRYTFDVHRPPTTTGQLLQAHLDGDTRPSVRAVHDHFTSVVGYDVAALWRGEVPGYAARSHPPGEGSAAAVKVAESLAGTYVDAHVWLFTPQSLAEQLHELRTAGRSAWRLTRLVPTAVHDSEFVAVLQRVPRASDPTAPLPDEVLAGADRPDWLAPPSTDDLVAGLQAKVAELEQRIERNRDTLREVRRRQRRRRTRDERRIAALERELADLRGRGLRQRITSLVRPSGRSGRS